LTHARGVLAPSAVGARAAQIRAIKTARAAAKVVRPNNFP